MTVEEQRKRIFEDESYVLDECRKLQTLFEMKRVIRYGMDREHLADAESVAEHIFAVHALALYFIPLEELGEAFDHARLHRLIEMHDIDEIETGDFISFDKTPEQIRAGKDAVPRVIARLPESMQEEVTALLAEYNAQETVESRFAKALDKVEPAFHVYSEHGMRINHNVTKATYEKHRRVKDLYTEAFPVIHRFSDVLSRALRDEGFFYTEG